MELRFQFLRQFVKDFSAANGADLTCPGRFYAHKGIASSGRGGKEDIGVEDNCRGHGLRLVQEAVDKVLATGFIESVPVKALLLGTLAELSLGKSHAFLAARTSLLGQG